MISAKKVADSRDTSGARLTSIILKYPRFIHAELLTHRLFSRNSASSRAIPADKILRSILEEPALPCHYGRNQRGMQAESELSGPDLARAKAVILKILDSTAPLVQELINIGLHKQVTNRYLEPFMHMTCLVSATHWGNFTALRAHKDAQPEFEILANMILDELQTSEPVLLKPGEWHMPFGDKMPVGCSIEDQLKITTARAARLSYLSFDGDSSPERDFSLHDDLKSAGHMSPFEHAAQSTGTLEWFGNFQSFKQYRKFIQGEHKQDPRLPPSPSRVEQEFVV